MMFIFVGLFLLGSMHSAEGAQVSKKNPDTLEVIVYADKELQRKRSSSALRKESTTPQHRPGLITEFIGGNGPVFQDSPTNIQHKATQTPPLKPLDYEEYFEAFTPTRRGTLDKQKNTARKVIKFTIQEKQPKSCCVIQ